MESRTGRSAQNHPSTPVVTAPAPVPPPPSTRRPRVREVSSRFMSPISLSSSSSGDLNSNSPRHLHQKSRRQLKLPDGGENRSSETARSLDSPFPLQHEQKQNRSSKPLKENGHRLDMLPPPPSRSRLNQQRLLTSSAAARLLRLSVSTDGEEDNKSNGSDHAKLSSAPASSPLRRSLSSSCDDVRASLLSIKGSSLPPVAPSVKSQADTRREKRVLGQQADAHCLKLLHNRYLQWRFANASAQVKTQAQKAQAERMFYTLGLKMSELSDSVHKKRIQLQRLLRVKAVNEIVESQIPYLEQWTTLLEEEEYSTSVSETSEALLNASLRLPLDADIKVEYNELAEALDVASKSMEGIVQNIGNFLPKTQEMEVLMSELARVSSSEKASVEDCGVALLKTHSSHIEECYLRSQLIQQHHHQK